LPYLLLMTIPFYLPPASFYKKFFSVVAIQKLWSPGNSNKNVVLLRFSAERNL
jgi:hypothetical protein